MTDANPIRTTVGTSGTVTVRQRPSLLLMRIRLRADEPTLELGLTKLKAQCESASQWLSRLGASRVDFGEPHFDDQTDKDPLTRMRVASVKAIGRGKNPAGDSPANRQRGVNAVLTATWNVASKSTEEILILMDRLRFEATQDVEPTEPAEESPSWSTPEEQIQRVHQMMTQLNQPPKDEGIPQFLCIAQLNDGQLDKALAEAFSRARQNAERLARAAGRRLGPLSSAHSGRGMADVSRTDKLMERQRCAALLAGTSYELGENEIVSDDPRPAEFTVSVNASYVLEQGEASHG